MDLSECINSELFEKIIQNGYQLKDFTIMDTKIEFAVSGGDNYTSNMYRIYVEIKESSENVKTHQFILKQILMSDNAVIFEMLMKAFEKEVHMLKIIMPRLTEIIDGVQLAPKYYYHLMSEPRIKILAMEDLKNNNYRMVDRKNGLDMDHCRIVLTKLGQMHAASMVLANEEPSAMDKFTFGLIHRSDSTPGFQELFLKFNFPTLCNLCKTWNGFEDIARKLEAMKENFWELVYNSASRKNDKYRVLNHGDFWINNLMFKYNKENGKPIDTLFVDFQISYYTSPGSDLQIFFNTSLQNHIRENHREDLLHIYYESFEATLKMLNHDQIPTFNDLLEEVHKWEMYGFMMALFNLPLVLVDRDENNRNGLNDLVDPTDASEKTRLLFTGEKITEVMKSILRRCDQLGIFDSKSTE